MYGNIKVFQTIDLLERLGSFPPRPRLKRNRPVPIKLIWVLFQIKSMCFNLNPVWIRMHCLPATILSNHPTLPQLPFSSKVGNAAGNLSHLHQDLDVELTASADAKKHPHASSYQWIVLCMVAEMFLDLRKHREHIKKLPSTNLVVYRA